ncbi:unnamed protein product [Danaus chrysippus]|uniref:(African queen) hypothetical protein n=1 Tax=Danaus chrysippus TaxID=151541 RepID=A0A8J2RBT2_9NEOP|nr:unnamed protein product [Danaus chrysippus]
MYLSGSRAMNIRPVGAWWCEYDTTRQSTIDQSTIGPAGCRSSSPQHSIAKYPRAVRMRMILNNHRPANGYNRVIKEKCFAKSHNILICLHKPSESG